MRTHRVVLISVVAALALACAGSPSAPEPVTTVAPAPPPLPRHTVTKDESMRDIKRTVEVTLPVPLNPDELTRLAKHLHKPGYERTFMLYVLPGMTPAQGAWATSHFNPTLDVIIMGATPDEIEAWGPVQDREGQETVGAWMEQGMGRRLTLYGAGRTYTLTTLFKDGSSMDDTLRGKQTDQGLVLTPKEPNEYGERYRIDAQGALWLEDQDGPIWILPPL